MGSMEASVNLSSSEQSVAHVVSTYVMSAVHIVALVVSASTEKFAAYVTFVASASLVASETVRLETPEVIKAITASLSVGYLATKAQTSSRMNVQTSQIVEIDEPFVRGVVEVIVMITVMVVVTINK
uniref:Uncharacterized protein n=1 Tax=Cannabis sativa TaxID=3483 RepID=A0A803NIG0_CANSA